MRIKLSIAAIILLFTICAFVSVYAADTKQQTAITQDGGISASWVLTGAFTLIGSLITFIIYDMKRQFTIAIKSVVIKTEVHETKLASHSELHAKYDERFKTIFNHLPKAK
jgi:hypothetical protein